MAMCAVKNGSHLSEGRPSAGRYRHVITFMPFSQIVCILKDLSLIASSISLRRRHSLRVTILSNHWMGINI